jgi:chromosome segregation ATPase
MILTMPAVSIPTPDFLCPKPKTARQADLDQAKEIAAAAEAASEEAGFNAEREKARLEESMSSAAEAHKAELEQLMNQLVETEDALENIKNEHQELRMTEQELRVEIEDLTAELSKGAGKKGGSRISMYVGGGGGADKRMSVYAGKGGAEPSGDAASLRRELGAKEQRAADAEKAKEKLERQAEHLKGELAAMKEENGALKKENRDKKCRLAALEKSKDDGEKVQECWAGL